MEPARLLYVGSYTNGRKEGIYRCRLDGTGSISVEQAIDGGPNPSYLAADSRRRFLFAVNETSEYQGKSSGAVSAFTIDPKDGTLRLLNRQPSHGAAPCHIVVDRSDRFVLVANYAGGSVAVFPIRDDGSLGEATTVVQHAGSSINKKRQEGPHAHCVAMSDDNRHAYVVDLGIDKIMIYRFDQGKGTLREAESPWIAVDAGTGPRHVALEPSGTRMYLVNELSPTLMAFSLAPSTGEAKRIQTILTIPEGFTGDNYGAAVAVTASGKRVYCSNRGHNSITLFSFDEDTGRLVTLQHQATEGNWPRSFAVDPDERFLLVANQRSDTVTVFAIDPARGTLAPTRNRMHIPAPACIIVI